MKDTATVFYFFNDEKTFKGGHLEIYYEIDVVERVLKSSHRSGQIRLKRAENTKGVEVIFQESDLVEDNVIHLLLERLGSVTDVTYVFLMIKTRPHVINLAKEF